MSLWPEFWSRDWVVEAPCHNCYPNHIAPAPHGQSCVSGEPTGRQAGPHRHFGLSPAGSRGQRPSHQAHQTPSFAQPQAGLAPGWGPGNANPGDINNLNDLYLLLDEENLTTPTHQTAKRAAAEEQPLGPAIKSSAVTSTLADLKLVLQDLSGELRQERQSSQELTQQFAKAKASWELERTELKSLITQLVKKAHQRLYFLRRLRKFGMSQRIQKTFYTLVIESILTSWVTVWYGNSTAADRKLLQRVLETKASKAAALSITDVLEPPDLKVALRREREEHQHLLAESYAAVMDLTKQSKALGGESSSDTAVTKGTGLSRTKSTSVMGGPEVNRTTNLEEKVRFIVPPLWIHPELSGLTKKNWTYLTDETPDSGGTCKTWDGPSSPCSNLIGSELDSIQRSYTAPDRTSIRIYYSPPAVRRMEPRRRNEEPQQAQSGSFSLDLSSSEVGVAVANTLEVQQQSFFLSSYDQWLSSPSKQHKELQESRNGCIPASIPSVINESVGGSATNVADGITPSCAFHGLDIGEISANLSDDMKEMTNCVRQAIRSSSLERKSTKDPGSQIDRIEAHSFGRMKYPAFLFLGSTSRLDGTSSSRDRSLWNLQQRAIGGGGGSAWARSTTTRDSPVLSGLTDGLSSLFSVVEHSGSTESLWRGDGVGASQGTSPQRQPLAAGKPSSAAVLEQEFLRNVCSSRGQGGVTLPVEKVQRDSQGSLGGLGILGGFGHVDEYKPECVSARVALQAGLYEGNDSVTRIVNKRFMRRTTGEEMVNIIRGGKEKMSNVGAAGSGTEVPGSHPIRLYGVLRQRSIQDLAQYEESVDVGEVLEFEYL
ncbi:hypothetical protein L3Q82_003416 [Scortum barcoo]|uniref:Uncharacterized protein n=1 Tax=Scortum barcoo TaxID=214431 RepID=A0ACB8VMA2_9TELE|nr:hypothetical protein L3Q82_003416 [Scortum barcoo]